MMGPLVLVLLAAPAQAEVGTSADGLPLVVVKVPSARCEARLVVRAGGRDDPQGKSGLAHLLEHVAFDDVTGKQLLHAGERTVNAATSASTTVYQLSAPGEACAERLGLLLRMVSEGHFDPAWLAHEKQVVLREQVSRRGHLQGFLENGLFPAGGVVGSEVSRRDITNEDLARFYREHYRPSNMALVVVGPLSLEQVREAAERSLLLPPELPSERHSAPPPPMAAKGDKERPVFAENPGDFSGLLALAAEVPPAQLRQCQLAADLFQLRLLTQLGADGAFAACQPVHGRLLLVMGTSVGSETLRALDFAKLVLSKLLQFANDLRRRRGDLERTSATTMTREKQVAIAQLQAQEAQVLRVAAQQQELVDKLEALVTRRKKELADRTAVLERLWSKAVKPVDAAERRALGRRRPMATSWAVDQPELLADLLDDVVAWVPAAQLEEAVGGWVSPATLDEDATRSLPAFLSGLERIRLVGQ